MRWKFLLLLDLLNVFAFAFWGPLFILYAVHLGAKPSLAGLLYGLYTAIHAAAFLFFGHLDKQHRRIKMIGLGFLGQAAAAIIFFFTTKPVLLILPLSISAIAGGAIAPAWKALYTRAVEVGKEGKAWSFYDAGEAGVIAAGTTLAGLLISLVSYRAIFIPLGVLNLIAAGLCLRLPDLKNT
jgi:MFS family permease